MNKLKVLCIHHTDLDGAMSAAVVGMFHRTDNITYKLYNYGWEIKPEELQGYDLIYAVDISFFQGGYDWVYRTPNLIAIDHHIGAIKKEELPEFAWVKNVPGIRVSDGQRAACELTWDYLFPGHPKPKLLEYLSAYDIWNKTRFDWMVTEEVEYGAKHMFGISPTALINFIDNGGQPEDLRETGKIILANTEKSYRSKLSNNGFYIHDFFGYRVMALNTPDFSSMSFMSHYDPRYFDIMMPFAIVPSNVELGKFFVRCSLYTENPNIDVSLIAEKFGGSGHKGSAGYTTSLETLQEILKCSGSLKLYMDSIGFKGNEPRRA